MKYFKISILSLIILLQINVNAENTTANADSTIHKIKVKNKALSKKPFKNKKTDSQKPNNWFVKTPGKSINYTFTEADHAEIIKLTQECLKNSESFSNCTNKSRDLVAKKRSTDLVHRTNKVSIQSQNRSLTHPLLAELNCTDNENYCVLCFYNKDSKSCSKKIDKTNTETLSKAKAFVAAIGASRFKLKEIPEKDFNASTVVSTLTTRVCGSLVKSVNLEDEINDHNLKIQEYISNFQSQCPSNNRIKGLLKTGIN